MNEDWFEQEIREIADLLLLAEIRTVYVTYGFGCNRDAVIQAEDIPVATVDLARFIADSEERGIFLLGESDLKVCSDIGKMEFCLCHEHDIHFYCEETSLLCQVRFRWARQYEHCYEQTNDKKSKLISISNKYGENF